MAAHAMTAEHYAQTLWRIPVPDRKRLRVEAGYDLDAVSEYIGGCPKGMILKWEDGERPPHEYAAKYIEMLCAFRAIAGPRRNWDEI